MLKLCMMQNQVHLQLNFLMEVLSFTWAERNGYGTYIQLEQRGGFIFQTFENA